MSNLKSISTSDLLAELLKRDEVKSLITKANNAITWDNWSDDDGNPYKLGEVYYCKLDWIKEYMLGEKYTEYEEGYDEELDEKLDIINDMQETICPILNLLDNE